MSFGGFAGANSGSTFGGFGNNANNTATTSAGGSLFGGGTATTGGFGGFGGSNNSTSSPFGAAKPTGFGAPAATTAGGSMFGGGTSTAGAFGGGGGFGATNNTGGGLFGANKPATTGFGASATGGGLFGSSAGGGFGGSTQQSNPFGGSTGAASNPFGGAAAPAASTGFGSSQVNSGSGFAFGGGNAGAAASTTQGTPAAPYTASTEKEAGTSNTTNAYQSLTFQQPFQNKSFEELRVEDYVQNKRYPQGNSFGSGSTFGGFGGGNTAQPAQTGGGLFGNAGSTTTGFGGGSTGTGFGAGATSGGLFGQNKPATTSLFGGANTSSAAPSTGFGATATGGGGLFGNTAQQPAASGGLFGGSGTTGGFGGNSTGGGLFGQANQAQPAKPAFGGFGATNNTTASTGFGGGFGATQQPAAQQPAQSGGLFGSSTTGGFGASNTSGGLFGGANQAKPATGGLFGNSTTSNTGGGLFGNSGAQNNAFGQAQPASGGLFGSAPQNNTTGGGLFGNNAAKPATGGLFGGSTASTGGSLFGNNQQQNTGASTSLFGGGQQAQQTGGLFGNTQAKPATGGLFGASNNGAQGGSLFGGAQQNNAGNSLFGNSQGQGNSLFGNSQGQGQAGNSLFGNSQQQQPQQNQLTATLTGDPYGNAQLFSSLAAPSPPVGPLATPLTGARAPPKPRASLLSSIRAGSPMLSASQSMTPKARPGYGFSYSTYNSPSSGSFNLSPGASSLLRPAGSIGSALSGRLSKSLSTSNLRSEIGDGSSLLRTPMNGQSSLLLGGSLLASGGGSLGSASMRRLKIDRNVRSDLFGPAAPAAPKATSSSTEEPTYPDLEREQRDTQRGGPRKSVSFDNNGAAEQNSNALVVREDDDDTTPTSTPAPAAPPASRQNSSRVLSSVVEEGGASQPAASKPSTGKKAKPDPRVKIPPGEYWTEPSMKEIRNMSRQQLSSVKDFKVGRENIGVILFNPGKTVDLSVVPLDELLPNEQEGKLGIVRLIPRNATVYVEPYDKIKPPVGQGINVPSLIHLEQSWPRSAKRTHSARPDAIAAERELSEHKRRLAKVGGTTLKDYDADTGIWTFTVPHYTSYGLDSDDEEDDDEGTGDLDLQVRIPTSMQSASNTHTGVSSASRMDTSGLSDAPATVPAAQHDDSDGDSELAAQEEDTFEFKLAKRSQQSTAVAIPGGFDDDDNSIIAGDHSNGDDSGNEQNDDTEITNGMQAGGAVQLPSPDTLEKYHSSMLLDEDEDEVDAIDQELPGSFLAVEPKAPKSILKTRTTAFASPDRVAEMTWEDQLLRTISPKKRDRQALRDMQAGFMAGNPDDAEESPFKKTLLDRTQLGQSYLATKSAKKSGNFGEGTMSVENKAGRSVGFATRMEMMDSLWGGAGEKSSRTRQPSALSRPLRPANGSADEHDSQWHESFKPHFTNADVLTIAVPDIAVSRQHDLEHDLQPLVGETKDVHFIRIAAAGDLDAPALALQKQRTELIRDTEDGADQDAVLLAEAPAEDFAFAMMAELPADETPLGRQEQAIWSLCAVLFDPVKLSARGLTDGMSGEQVQEYEARLRLDALKQFWTQLIRTDVDARIASTRSRETKALYLLVNGDTVAASQTLAEAGNTRLAILVSQLPSSAVGCDMIKVQIEAWQKRKDWTEFSDPIKALWSVLAGETCSVAGVSTGGPEDRAKGFTVSERFELDWKMALALRMQFSGAQSIEDLVHGYLDDLDEDTERVAPSGPWGEDEDTLLGLLRLHAYSDAPVSDAIEPQAVSGNAMHARLSWQLATLLHAKGFTIEDADVDKISVALAAQLEAAGEWAKAAWVLMHLREPETRVQAMKQLLDRNAAQLPDQDEDEAMDEDDGNALWRIDALQLPKQLIENAKALHAASVLQDPAAQVSHLLAADTDESLAEAHDVLCDTVGPGAIISRSYDELRTLIRYFTDASAPARLEEWKTGGKLYADFLLLHDMEPRKRQGRDGRNVCYALGKALSAVTARAKDGEVEVPLVVRVAMGEMAKMVRLAEKDTGYEGLAKGGAKGSVREMGRGGVERMWEGYQRALSAA